MISVIVPTSNEEACIEGSESLKGFYVNINYPKDIEIAKFIVKS